MKLFSKLFTSFLLGTFGIFLASPIFASGVENHSTIILGTNFSDTCNWNIQCETSPDGQYICSSGTETLSEQGGSVHHIPVGKYGTDIIVPCVIFFQFLSEKISQEKNITYIEPDTYIYPFVGIIKIQV